MGKCMIYNTFILAILYYLYYIGTRRWVFGWCVTMTSVSTRAEVTWIHPSSEAASPSAELCVGHQHMKYGVTSALVTSVIKEVRWNHRSS
jgi:hypothetical protein